MCNFVRFRVLWVFVLLTVVPALIAAPPAVGETAPDFALSTIEGRTVRLSELTSKALVVLIVLRGYPGYQCPFCNRQAQDFLQKSGAFAKTGAHVVMIYPGPPHDLRAHAQDFMDGKKEPANFDLLLDPGYEFTSLYGVRWDAPRETAYPSTFMIDRNRTVVFSKVVKVHGGRTTAGEVLDMLPKQNTGRH
jgi:thioredoxin-dependent peroxiredoxin